MNNVNHTVLSRVGEEGNVQYAQHSEDKTEMDEIKILIGKKIRKIGRSGNMVWILIGNEIMQDNQKRRKYEYALHLQCPWRIEEMGKKEILVADDDIYSPKKDVEWSNDFNWDIQGNNAFDEKVTELFNNREYTICDCSQSCFNELEIKCIEGIRLVTFLNSSSNLENWRLLDNVNRKHIVCVDGKIEEV